MDAMNNQNEELVLQNMIYQISEPKNPIEILVRRTQEDFQKFILYHAKTVTEARTDDMYLDRLMCE
jgi:hypothetical protein